MLLDDLVGVIETLKERIATHGRVLRENETRTRMTLIDPLLQALGWDISDPAMVLPEYRVDVGWADYAPLGVGNKPAAVIEAKRLGSVVENHLDQAVGYCIQQGIAYAGVTDGSHWQLYRTFEPVPLVEKLVLDLSIADMPAHEFALKLLLLWRPNLSTGQPVKASASVFPAELHDKSLNSAMRGGPPARLAQSSDPPTEITQITQVESDSAITERGWKPLSDVVPTPGDRPPSSLRLADGSERGMRKAWVALVESAAEWLWSNGLLTLSNVPIQSSSRRN